MRGVNPERSGIRPHKRAGGTLYVHVGPLQVAKNDEVNQLCVPPGGYYLIGLRDTGPGVDPLVRDRVFEPFVTTVRGEGRGLGLSQVYRTVHQMRGHILYCPDGKPGASFAMLFPA